jgi:predicted phage terminase large subunit-like protein
MSSYCNVQRGGVRNRADSPMSKVLRLSPAIRRALADELLRREFVAFIRRTFETVVPGEELHLNWHIRAMAHVLERVRRGKIKRLIITVPPRHLKSITASVAFPAFVLGHDPTKKFVCLSYSGHLAVKHAADFRAVVNAPWYRRIFPAMRISSEKNTEFETVTTRRGGRLATSVGGTLTGRGGNLIVLDDAMNPKQGMSEASRKSVIQWFQNTLLSRLNLKGEDVIIIVMQRLHVDDLVGVLLEQGGWHHLNLPAIADGPEVIPIGHGKVHRREVDDVLDPVREPRHVLEELKARMGLMDFTAQYLQRPIPAEGNLIKREWLKTYRTPPQPQPLDTFVLSWDTAMKASEIADYSVGTVWHIQGDNCYLLDLIRNRFDFPDLKRAVMKQKEQYPSAHILIEDKGSGTSLIQELRHQQIAVISINCKDDKVTRLFSTQPRFESGSVHFPEQAPWLEDLITELLAFPHGRHDDQVDSIAQALAWLDQRKRSSGVVIAAPMFFRLRNPYREAFPDYDKLPR